MKRVKIGSRCYYLILYDDYTLSIWNQEERKIELEFYVLYKFLA